jgi:serine/threonine protein kinase/Flp pilus assembly protein TadD
VIRLFQSARSLEYFRVAIYLVYFFLISNSAELRIMASQRQIVEEIFGAALDLDPEQRSIFVAHACRESPELQPLVEELLLENERAGSFLEKPLLQLPGNTAENNSATREPPHSSESHQPAKPSASRFKFGETLGDRFIVVRFIARGGMGEVYEVEDTFLQGTHVALKMILPHAAIDSAMERRFEQEVLLARKVIHANLCPIYEIFHCEKPSPPFSCLTMKLLPGETLATRLMQSELIPRDEAVAICIQLISGLAAIHAAGVIHRDIKPNNVMLDHRGSGIHVWITDFGLARLYESEMTLASTGAVAGTPGYIAPELIKGQLPSQASDIFALGVVMHEIFVGEKPNTPGVVSATLKAKGTPSDFVHLITEFLAGDPKRRCVAFEKAQCLFDSKSNGRTVPMSRKLWRTLAILSIVLLAMALGIALRRKLAGYAVPPHVSVVVTEFENRTGDPAFDQTPRELISTALGQSHQVFVFPSSRLPEVLRRMELPESDVVNEHVGTEICTREGLQSVIAGSISKLGSSYLIVVRVLNCNGDPIISIEKGFSGPEHLPSAIDEIAATIRHRGGESKAAIQQASQPLALVTSSSLEALKLYSSGKQQLYLGNFARATSLFEKAVEMDSNFAMAHEYLATSYEHVDDDDRAAEEFAKAVQLSGRVTEREREKILGDYAIFQYDSAKAIPHYQVLAALTPDDPAVYLNLAECYRNEFRFDLAVSEAKKAVDLTASPSPKINLATYYYLGGNTQQAMALTQQVLKENREDIKALNLISNSYLGVGKEAEAAPIWKQMLAFGGNSASMARATMADAAETRDNLSEATIQLEYALNADSEIGNTYGMSKDQIYLADIYRASGNRTALIKSLHDLSEPSIPELIYFLGKVYARSGRLGGAERELRRLEETADKTPRVMSYLNMLQSEIAIAQNRPPDGIRSAILAIQHLNSPLAIETLAKAYEVAGRGEDAAQQYELLLARSNERQFDSADSPALHAVAAARYHLGVLYQSLDRNELALKEFNLLLIYAGEAKHTGPLYEDARKRLAQVSSKAVAQADQHQLHTESTP